MLNAIKALWKYTRRFMIAIGTVVISGVVGALVGLPINQWLSPYFTVEPGERLKPSNIYDTSIKCEPADFMGIKAYSTLVVGQSAFVIPANLTAGVISIDGKPIISVYADEYGRPSLIGRLERADGLEAATFEKSGSIRIDSKTTVQRSIDSSEISVLDASGRLILKLSALSEKIYRLEGIFHNKEYGEIGILGDRITSSLFPDFVGAKNCYIANKGFSVIAIFKEAGVKQIGIGVTQ